MTGTNKWCIRKETQMFHENDYLNSFPVTVINVHTDYKKDQRDQVKDQQDQMKDQQGEYDIYVLSDSWKYH